MKAKEENMLKKRKNGPGIPLYAALAVMLALVLIGTFTIGRTTGQKSVLADTFIDNVSAKTIAEVEDEIAAGISQDVIRDAVVTQFSTETVKEMIKESLGDSITESQVDAITETVISEVCAAVADSAPQEFLTSGQKSEVKKMISETVTENLGSTDVGDISDADIEAVKEQVYSSLKGTVASMVQENISNYSYTLSDADVEKITNTINVEEVVKKVVEEEAVVSEADFSKLQKDITASIKESVKTPVAGVDYLTAKEVTAIEDAAATKASQTVSTELTGVKTNLNTVQTSVSSMNSQMSTLSARVASLESSGGSSASNQDVQNLQNAVATINQNITDINAAAEALAGKVDITNGFLRRITASNGSIDEAEVVDTSGMSIAEFVNILAGNEIEYTTAINQLYGYVTQLQSLVGGNITTLSRDVASLQAGLDAASGTITTLSQAITDEENARISAIDELSLALGTDIGAVNDALEAYKSVVSNTYATPEEITEAQETLRGALTQITDDLQDKYDSLSDDTRDAADAINGQIDSILTSLSSEGDIGSTIDTIDSAVGTLNTSVSGLNSSLSILSEQLTVEQTARIEGDEAVKAELETQLSTKVAEVNSALEAYKSVVSNTYATPAEIAEAKQNLEASISSLDATIIANKSVLDQLDTDTKASVSAIQGSIASMNATLGSNADDIDALETAVGNINSNVGTVQTSLAEETSAREQADNTLDGKITAVNQALDAYKTTVANTYATPAEIAAAKSELETAVGELETVLGTVESTAGTNSTNITAAQQAIAAIQQTLASDESDIDGLQNAANDLNTAVSGLEGQLNALSESISGGTGDNEILESAAGGIGGSTILAKLGSIWNLIAAKDSWAENVLLHNSAGANSGKDVYQETNSNGDLVYVLDGSELGLNFKTNSDVTIKYNVSTPDIIVTYEQGDGYLKIIVDKDCKTLVTGDITIDSIHVESQK